jgi:quercetin dioxygenase-like cupin family protein
VKHPIRLALFAGLFASGSFAAGPPPPDPQTMRITLGPDIEWHGDPAKGELVHPLFGDPKGAGMYGFLVKILPGHFSKPHSFSQPRYITVLSGTWWVSSSQDQDPARTYPVPAGSLIQDMPGRVRWAGAKETPAIIEVVGMGPLTVKDTPQPEFF